MTNWHRYEGRFGRLGQAAARKRAGGSPVVYTENEPLEPSFARLRNILRVWGAQVPRCGLVGNNTPLLY